MRPCRWDGNDEGEPFARKRRDRMEESSARRRAPRRSPREPSQRETLAVMCLAIFCQGIESFILLAWPGLSVLFVCASGLLALLLYKWVRYLVSSERLALLLTATAAAAVPWITFQLAPMGNFSGAGLFWGLVFPYGLAAILPPSCFSSSVLNPGEEGP